MIIREQDFGEAQQLGTVARDWTRCHVIVGIRRLGRG